MKNNLFAIAALFVFSSFVFTQNRSLTIDDIYSPDTTRRVQFGGSPVSVTWSSDGRSFRQTVNGQLMRVDAVTGEAVPLYDSRNLTLELTRAGMRADQAERLANSAGSIFNAAESAILFYALNDVWYYDITGRKLRRLTNNPDEEKELALSPDGKKASFVRGNNIFVADVAKGGEKQLTRDGREGDKAIYNGYLDWVYEEELYGRGNKRGYWWSPDSSHIAFLQLNEERVPRFTIVDDMPIGQRVEVQHYPKAGDPNPVVRLGIADINALDIVPNTGRIPKVGTRIPGSVLRIGDAVRYVDTSIYKPEDLLIARVAWAPDSRNILFQALDREQTFLDLNSAGLDGKVRKALTETTPAYVEVYGDPLFANTPRDGEVMVWQSARNGWRHLYLYNNDGKLVRQLTDGKWEVRSLLGVDKTTGWVYFSATKDSHIAENIYRVALTGGEPQRLTAEKGWHIASFDPTFNYFADLNSDVMTPLKTRLFRSDGKPVRTINENNVGILDEYRRSTPEFLKVKTRDGFEMEAMMIKPVNFDPKTKYPVLQFTYSGPHAPMVADRWSGSRGMWFQMLAQKGYIVWICDNRTASGKGEVATWPIYKNMYSLELRDLEDGVDYLKSLPFVDGGRIALHGWSYGGTMTAYAMTHSTAWKLGIAGGTVTDERLYDSIYTERYMMTPQNNPAGYESSSVIRSADGLKGKLLLIHGQMDDNVHMQNTTQLIMALQKAGKQFDVMYYPTARHGVSDPFQIYHWYTMMTDYLDKNL